MLALKPERWPLDVWIDQYHEDALDPERRIIDAHHHLWDPLTQPRGWPLPRFLVKLMFLFMGPRAVAETIARILDASGQSKLLFTFGLRQLPFCQPYMADDFLFDVQNRGTGRPQHRVVKTVYVECGWAEGRDRALKAVGEVHMVSEEHAKDPMLCSGSVAFADLRLPDVEKVLRMYGAMASVKGVRHGLAWTKDARIAGSDSCAGFDICDCETATDPAFRRGFALLEKYGLSYDAWIFHDQLGGLTELAKSFPGTTIIVNHVGMPLGISEYTREGTFPVWVRAIRELAEASTNVHVKLSGFAMRTTGFHFDEEPMPPTSADLAVAWSPYVKVCLDAFGVRRCMFASNFPVDKVSCDYTVLWNAFKLITEGFSEADKDMLFYENARRVYRL